MQNLQQASNQNYISAWKRLGTYLADLVIFLILSITIYSIAVVPLAKAITPYNSYYEESTTCFEKCQDIAKNSKLVLIDENGKESKLDTLINEDLQNMLDGKYKENNGDFIEIFYYFYLDYVPTLTLEAPQTYNIEWVNKNVFGISTASIIFEYDESKVGELVTFKEEAKTNLQAYLNGEENSESLKYYQTYLTKMSNAWQSAADLLSNSKDFSEPSKRYSKLSNQLMLIYSISSLITFTILFFLYYLLVPALFGKGQTFAKKILHVGVFDEEGKAISFKTLLVKSIVLYVLTFFAYSILPIYHVGMSMVTLPLFIIGDTIIYAFSPSIICFIASVVCYFVAVNSPKHQSLVDKVLRIQVMKENPDYIEENPETEDLEAQD